MSSWGPHKDRWGVLPMLPCTETPYLAPQIPWLSLSILLLSVPSSQAARRNCCHCASQHSGIVKIIISFLSPPCRFCRGTSSPCQDHAKRWVVQVSLPWFSARKTLSIENLIVDVPLAIICWGDFLLEWQPHLLHSSKVAVCILVPSASGAFPRLYSGYVSTQSGPL